VAVGELERPARRSRFRSLLFGNLWMTLSGSLGVMQAAIGQWVAIVLLGRDGLSTVMFGGVAALLVGVNLYTVPALRRARQRGGTARRAASFYMSFGVATLFVGLALLASGLVFGSLAGLLSLVGAPGAGGTLFRTGSSVAVLAVAGAMLWAFTGGQMRVQRTHERFEVPGLASALRGLRIVQLSDLHIGNGMEGARLAKMVADANALDPDLIVLTGDLFDFDPRFVEEGAKGLSGLRARYGVYAVLGNHDTYTGTEHVVSNLRAHAPGMRVLRDEIVKLPVQEPLYLAGVEDPGRNWTARDVHLPALDRLAAERPSDGPVLLLVHRPEAFPQAAKLGFPLVLAGHTHGGQLALPTPSGRLNLSRVMTNFSRGIYRLHDSTLYVNRGIGVAGPALRFNCPREIATIELV
jgi:predicted MPP superfamily phosphohydrolase